MKSYFPGDKKIDMACNPIWMLVWLWLCGFCCLAFLTMLMENLWDCKPHSQAARFFSLTDFFSLIPALSLPFEAFRGAARCGGCCGRWVSLDPSFPSEASPSPSPSPSPGLAWDESSLHEHKISPSCDLVCLSPFVRACFVEEFASCSEDTLSEVQ